MIFHSTNRFTFWGKANMLVVHEIGESVSGTIEDEARADRENESKEKVQLRI